MDKREQIAAAMGAPVDEIDVMGGGCVSSVYRVRLRDGKQLVAKVDETKGAGLLVEADMLRYLAEHTALPVPVVLYEAPHMLLMSFIPGESVFTPSAERHAAEHLAALHDISAPAFGFAQDTLIGGLRQPNKPAGHWIEFFREQRLLYMARQATAVRRLPAEVCTRIERLGANLGRWLIEPERASLIHGDVWTTNLLADGDRIVAFLDPAIYFADAEVELAFTTLFHTFGPTFYERYDELRPIQPGFMEERRHIYNLYPLLVHVRLFGGSYVSAVEQVLTRFGY